MPHLHNTQLINVLQVSCICDFDTRLEQHSNDTTPSRDDNDTAQGPDANTTGMSVDASPSDLLLLVRISWTLCQPPLLKNTNNTY